MKMQQQRLPRSPPFKTTIIKIPSIPIIYHDEEYCYHGTTDNLQAFLNHDLDVSRLASVQPHLWLAGRKMAARPLHRQAMMNRQVIVVEQADLHLTWQDTRIYIKPLPSYLLNRDFWRDNLCSNDSAGDKRYTNALGFLLSYAWLVPYECDFQMAMDGNQHPRLLPKDLTYEQWSGLLAELVSVIDLRNPTDVSPRYHYGELRISRLNLIYRLAWGKVGMQHFLRGYLYGYHDYGTFLQRNLGWLVAAFASVATLLTAMQVGLATDRLVHDRMFQDACYGLAVFAIAGPVELAGIIVLWIAVLFVNNLVVTLVHLAQVERVKKPVAKPVV